MAMLWGGAPQRAMSVVSPTNGIVRKYDPPDSPKSSTGHRFGWRKRAAARKTAARKTKAGKSSAGKRTKP